MIAKRAVLLLFTISILLTNTSCWNNRDLSEISICSAYGIDITEDGKVMISVQLVKPSAAKTSGKEGGGGEEKKNVLVVSDTADTVFGAVRELLSKVNNKIFYSSAQIIVLGESIARTGIEDYIDFILRDHETQYKSVVVVTKNITAKEVLEQEYGLSKIPGAYLRDTVNNVESRAFVKKLMLIEVARELATEGRELSIGTILKEEKSTITEGSAVFLDDKLIGWLDKYETRGYMFAKGRVKSTILEVEDPKDNNKQIAVEIQRTTSKEKVNMGENGNPKVSINIKVYGVIGEQQAETNNESKLLKEIITNCNEKIEKEVLETIKKCQMEYHSDIFGYGAKLFDKYPDYWSSVKDNWNGEGFKDLEINIKVDTNLTRTGLLEKPITIK